MNLTYKIIETATEMFVKRGIKAVSVDEISAELGISKRTLYEQVKSKEELVDLSFQFFSDNCKKRFTEIFERQTSVFERMVKMIETQLNILRSINKSFFDELIKRGKETSNERKQQAHYRHHKYFVSLITEGQNEGVILQELDSEIVVKILESQMMALGQSSFYDFSQISFFDVYRTMWSIHLNGIATDKGREILKTVQI